MVRHISLFIVVGEHGPELVTPKFGQWLPWLPQPKHVHVMLTVMVNNCVVLWSWHNGVYSVALVICVGNSNV